MNRVYPPVRGATGRVLRDLTVSLSHAGWRVTVITTGPEAGQTYEGDIRVIRVKGPAKPRNFLSYMFIWFKMFICAMNTERHDLLVSMTDPPLLVVVGSIVSRFKKSRHMNWCHDLYPDVMPALGMRLPDLFMRFFRGLRIKAMKKCDKVIVCGRCMAQRLKSQGIPQAKITTVPNWPDRELTDPDMMDVNGVPYRTIDKDIVRPFEQQLKKNQRFRVLYSGNLGLAHPIDTILQAAQHFAQEDTDIEFVFVGDGARFDDIAQFRALHHLDNITLLPFQPVSRLREIMESGDVHLVTMKEEAAGYVVPCKLYSALAVARPTIFIGPVQSECAKVISDYESGLVVASDDQENLINAISFFRKSGEAWFDAHRGAIQAREVFTPNNSISKWHDQACEAVNKNNKVA